MFRHAPTLVCVSILISVALVGLAGPVAAQENQGFERCGDSGLILIFKNEDLMPQSDGYVRASGLFFIQFQAIGERALDITKFAFSFGKPIPDGQTRCEQAEDNTVVGPHLTGAYIYKYRADDDPRDGFFVPINTTLVPDGEYGAAVSAFDASGAEIVRYYTKAIVKNGCQLPRCEDADVETIRSNDHIKPLPIVLPGDGEQVNGVGGLTVEFGEPLAQDPDVWITPAGSNVQQRVPIQPWEGRTYDDDAVPDNPLMPSPVQLRSWGPAYHWPGTIRTDDIIRVRAVDLNGNQVEKILHIGDPTIGGRIVISYPEFDVEGSGAEKVADEDGRAVFQLRFKNVGNGTAHGNLLLDELPDGLRARFDKDHPITGSGETHHANLTVTALSTLPPGTYEVNGQVRYHRAGTDVSKPFNVRFVLEERTENEGDDEVVVKGSRPDDSLVEEPLANESVDEPEPEVETKGFLGIPAPLPLLSVLAALVLARASRSSRRG